MYPCWTVCIACCAYALCLVRYANRFIFGLVIAVLLMAGAIVGLVIASNEITKENHTTEGTLVSKDKGEAVRLRLRPASNAPNYFGRVINSTCISIGRSPLLTSASVRQASRGAARTGCCAIYNVRLQIYNPRLQRRRVRRVCLRAFVCLLVALAGLREQVQVASVQSYASLLDLVVLSTTTLSKLERVTFDYQARSAAQRARCSARARATLCVCDTVRARAANAARSLRRVRSLPALPTHASALPRWTGRPRKRADGTAALRGLVRGMLCRAWTCARANAACSLSVVRRRPSAQSPACRRLCGRPPPSAEAVACLRLSVARRHVACCMRRSGTMSCVACCIRLLQVAWCTLLHVALCPLHGRSRASRGRSTPRRTRCPKHSSCC